MFNLIIHQYSFDLMKIEVNPTLVRRIIIEPLSSLIEKLTYDQSSYILYVKYKSGSRKGRTHEYPQVSLESFMRILESESVGRAVVSLAKRSKELEQHDYPVGKPTLYF